MSGAVLPRRKTVRPRPAWHAWENLSDAVGVTSMLLGLALCALAIVGG